MRNALVAYCMCSVLHLLVKKEKDLYLMCGALVSRHGCKTYVEHPFFRVMALKTTYITTCVARSFIRLNILFSVAC